MTQPWIGPAQHLFIPVVVNGGPYHPPPPDFRAYVQRRVHYDPDPLTGADRSLSHYLAAISYGRAWLDARVSEPVVLHQLPADGNVTLAAINAQPNSHLYEYLCVVTPENPSGARGMAQPGQVPFDPPRSPNLTQARAYVRYWLGVGGWAMEILHCVTRIGDYYNGLRHPGNFDEMAGAQATHPTVFTKLIAGWVDPASVAAHSGSAAQNYTLHAVALPHPPSAGRVAAVTIQAPGSERYLMVEARLRSDQWDRGFRAGATVSGTNDTIYPGIPQEGVLIYEFSPSTSSWPRDDPNGPWPPLERRAVLGVGESFEHFDDSTGAQGPDRIGVGLNRTIRVVEQTAGGFRIEVQTDDRSVGRSPDSQPEMRTP